MSVFDLSNFTKISQIVNQVSGPAVDAVIRTVNDMYGRGAPRSYDDFGFNKIHYNDPDFTRMASMPLGSQVPVDLLIRSVQKLQYYSKRQLAGTWEQLRQGVDELIRQNMPAQENQGNNVIQIIRKDQYGNLRVTIPGLGPKSAIKKNLDSAALQFASDKSNFDRRWLYNGSPAGFKAFSKPKDVSSLDEWAINEEALPALLPILEGAGYDISSLRQNNNPQQQQEEPANIEKTIKYEGKSPYGSHIFSITGLPPDMLKRLLATAEMFAHSEMKSNYKKWSYNGRAAGFKAFSPLKGEKNKYQIDAEFMYFAKGILEIAGFDTSEMAAIEEEEKRNHQPDDQENNINEHGYGNKVLSARNISTSTSFLVGLSFPRKTNQKDELKEIIKFSFPSFGTNDDSMRSVDTDAKNWIYQLRGEYNDFVNFGMVLKASGWNVGPGSEYRQVISELIKSGHLNSKEYDGKLEGFQKKDENGKLVNDKEGFEASVNQRTVPNGKQLFPKQLEDVAWLYSRKSAILGDDTGVGKCLSKDQTIIINGNPLTCEQLWNKYNSNAIINISEKEEWCLPNSNIFIDSYNGENIKIKEIVGLFRQKYKGKLRKIKTWRGKNITTTFEHKFLTPSGWSNDLKVGDCILSPKIIDHSNYESFCTNDLAYIMGWQISEGCEVIDGNRIIITQNDLNVLNNIHKTLNRVLEYYKIQNKLTGELSKSFINIKDNKSSNVTLTSCEYVKFLQSNGYLFGNKSKEKEIPEFIMQSSNEIIKIFLQAYFDAESHCYTKSRRIDLSSASRKVIQQLSYLLMRFGIEHSFGQGLKSATNGTKIKRMYYRLYITGSGVKKFIEQIGFSYDYKNKAFNSQFQISNPNREGKPLNHILIPFFEKYDIPFRHVNIKDKNYIYGKKWASNNTISHIIDGFNSILNGNSLKIYSNLKKSKWTDSTLATYDLIDTKDVTKVIYELQKLMHCNLNYERIESIDEIYYNDYIYDLTIPDNQNYIAEGLICHNTYQLIAAADQLLTTNEKLQKSGKRGLIISLKSVVNQFGAEVKNLLGKEEDISVDDPTKGKWVILRYPTFSSRSNRDALLKKNPNLTEEQLIPLLKWNKPKTDFIMKTLLAQIAAGEYGLIILDELHTVKNDSTTTENIGMISKNIPTKWGASATVIANKPIDAHNQLKVIGHRLGKFTRGQFLNEFGGRVLDRNTGRYTAGSEEDILKAADKLRQWLILSGVYTKKSKKDVNPNMPPMSVSDNIVEIDTTGYEKAMKNRWNQYKNPDLAISEMSAQRIELAKAKVPATLDHARSILQQGKKLFIFTDYVDTVPALQQGLSETLNELKEEGLGGSVLTHVGIDNQKQRDAAVEKMKDPKSDAKVLIISIKTGGTGLSFTDVVQDVIVNDFSWTPKDMTQILGRAYRVNSKLEVDAKIMIAGNTVDEDFYNWVKFKIKLADKIQILDQKERQAVLNGVYDPKIKEEKAAIIRQEAELNKQLMENIRHRMGDMHGDKTAKSWYKNIK